MDYFDISPVLRAELAVFPGDVPFARHCSADVAAGDSYTLSSMTTTLHCGAHADAPNHYHSGGCGIERRSLDYYLGRCQVIRVPAKPAPYRLLPADLAGTTIDAPRVLFATGSFPDPTHWTNEFTALSPELIDDLAQAGVCLVGLDTPSIDPAEAKELISHQAVYRHDMAILEGLVLNEVPEGCYQLIAPPLAIAGGDASPVRAVLLPLNESLVTR